MKVYELACLVTGIDLDPFLFTIDVDECRTFPNGYCDSNANCRNTIGSHVCTCNDGFTGTGKTCISM